MSQKLWREGFSWSALCPQGLAQSEPFSQWAFPEGRGVGSTLQLQSEKARAAPFGFGGWQACDLGKGTFRGDAEGEPPGVRLPRPRCAQESAPSRTGGRWVCPCFLLITGSRLGILKSLLTSVLHQFSDCDT